MSKFLDNNGVLYLWNKIKAKFVQQETGKGLSANDFTDALKTKLDGIAEGATAYTLPEATSTTLGGVKLSQEGIQTDGYSVAKIGKQTTDGKVYANVPMATKSVAGVLLPSDGLEPATVPMPMGAGEMEMPGWFRVSTMGGATAEAAGTFGAPPAPAAGDQEKFLKGDGTWDVAYTHPAYTARTGYPRSNATPAFGATFTVSQINCDATGHVTAATSRTVKIPDTEATNEAAGLMSATDKAKLDAFGAASDYALKTDLTGLYKYKGSVATVSALPTGATTGDVYDVQADGMNYAWNGTAWDALGATFTIDAITNAELDSICA